MILSSGHAHKYTVSYLALIVVIFGLFLTAKADILSVHCPLGCPSNPIGNDLIFGHVYALSNDPDTKFADWAAFLLDKEFFESYLETVIHVDEVTIQDLTSDLDKEL